MTQGHIAEDLNLQGTEYYPGNRAFCPSPFGGKLWTFVSIPDLHGIVMKYKGNFTVL